MAIALVQQKAFRNGTTSTTVTLTSTPTAGNLLVACVGANGGSGPTVNTPSGWTLLISRQTNNCTPAILFKVAGASESTGQTFTTGGTATATEATVTEWSGLSVPTADRTAGNDSSGATVNTLSSGTTATTDSSGDLAIACVEVNATVSAPSADSGFTTLTLASSTKLIAAYKILSGSVAAGTTFSWTSTAAKASAVVGTISPVFFTPARNGFLAFM